jgi:uncharacterized lipoprotein YajG
MKKILFLAISFALLISACKKEELLKNETPVIISPVEKTIATGLFVSNAHKTSGSAKIIVGTDKKNYLVLENLVSDSGPDLRIYLSEDKTIKNSVEVTTKIVIGNSKFEIPASADLNKQKTVLIWCKQFSVLFGNVELK